MISRSTHSTFQFQIYALLALLTLPFVGCEEPGPPTGTLTGVVTSNGDTVDDCRLRLYHPETRKYSGAVVDAEGKFKTGELALGNYQVSITQKPPTTLEDDPFDKRIPAKYRKLETSGFEVEIVEGENQSNFEMTR